MIIKKELPLCPVATTVGLIGNKWKLLVLQQLLTGAKRFGELRKSIPDISQKVLTQNLRSMEEDGIITRHVFAEVPPRVEYELSELGCSLRPIIDVMQVWGLNYQKMVTQEVEQEVEQ
jgi:DNA-binding HxlR family transcriptional regulator